MRLEQKKPVICCGDINVAHAEVDLASPQASTDKAGFTPEERNDLGKLLLSGFVDCFDIYTRILAILTLFGNMVSDIENAIWDGDWIIL